MLRDVVMCRVPRVIIDCFLCAIYFRIQVIRTGPTTHFFSQHSGSKRIQNETSFWYHAAHAVTFHVPRFLCVTSSKSHVNGIICTANRMFIFLVVPEGFGKFDFVAGVTMSVRQPVVMKHNGWSFTSVAIKNGSATRQLHHANPLLPKYTGRKFVESYAGPQTTHTRHELIFCEAHFATPWHGSLLPSSKCVAESRSPQHGL